MAAETTIDSAINTTSNGPILYTEHEEYRYDALGRRIWVRSIHAATCHIWYPNGDCASALKREVWDGASLIYESRYPGDLNLPAAQLEQETGAAGGTLGPRFGRVAYLNGGGLDHPLAEIKMDGGASTATFAPRYNWRGLAEEPVCAAGQSCGTQYFGASSVSAYYEVVPTPNGPPAWSGSLIEGSRDASGLLYKRNRYYDPASGRFTSQDPLGLGGSLNVYGFADGDPVNDDDRFGLCPYSGDKRNTDLDDCPDDKRRDAFRLMSRNALGRSYISFVAKSGIDINLHHGTISCSGRMAEGCSDYLNMRTELDDKLGVADLATTIVHETQHFINNLNALDNRTIHVGSFSSDEIHAYAAGFTFLNTLPAAMRATAEYGPWAAAYAKNPRAALHAICVETHYSDCK